MRTMLPSRRRSFALNLKHEMNGNEVELAVHFGVDDQGCVKECFCLPFKTGTDMQAMLHQGCIAISLGLQHGMTMHELRSVLGEDDRAPKARSFFGLIVRAGACLDAEQLTKVFVAAGFAL